MKKCKHISLLICLLFSCSFLSSKCFSQSGVRWEAGVIIGPSFFLGDLGGNAGKGTRFIKDVNLEYTRIIKGGFICMYPNDWLGLRLAAQTGYLHAEDDIIDTRGTFELFRKQRNLDFRSTLAEAYIVGEVYPLMYLQRNDESPTALQPYFSIGVGVFHFNPQGSLTDAAGNRTWYYLKPLRTEGEGMAEYPNRKEYSLTQPILPIGGGVKYYLSERVSISLEVLARKSFTDYIDDVSTAYIDPELFDKYLTPENAAIARRINDKIFGTVTPGASRVEPGSQRGNRRQNDSFFSILFKAGFRLGSMYENVFSKGQRDHMRCAARVY